MLWLSHRPSRLPPAGANSCEFGIRKSRLVRAVTYLELNVAEATAHVVSAVTDEADGDDVTAGLEVLPHGIFFGSHGQVANEDT